MLDLQYLTDAWLKKYKYRLYDPSDINYGDCYRWSFLAHRLHGGQLISVTITENNTSHAFLKIGDKYYDSETPQGIKNWRRLPYFDRTRDWYSSRLTYKIKEHCSRISFRRYWKFYKKQIKSDYKLYLELKKSNQKNNNLAYHLKR